MELLSTSKPKLFAEVLTLSTVIEFSRSLLLGIVKSKSSADQASSSRLRVRVFAPRLIAVPE